MTSYPAHPSVLVTVWPEQRLGFTGWMTEPPEELPAHHVTSPSQHKTIVHTGAYSQSAVVEQCIISLVWSKCSKLGLERQRLWGRGIDTLRRRWVNSFNSDGEGKWPENKLGKVLGLLTKDNWSSWKKKKKKWQDFFWLSDSLKMNLVNCCLFRRDHLKVHQLKIRILKWFSCSVPMLRWVDQHLAYQCAPSSVCLALLSEQYWNTCKPVLHYLVENMQTAGKVFVQLDTYKLNPNGPHLMEK